MMRSVSVPNTKYIRIHKHRRAGWMSSSLLIICTQIVVIDVYLFIYSTSLLVQHRDRPVCASQNMYISASAYHIRLYLSLVCDSYLLLFQMEALLCFSSSGFDVLLLFFGWREESFDESGLHSSSDPGRHTHTHPSSSLRLYQAKESLIKQRRQKVDGKADGSLPNRVASFIITRQEYPLYTTGINVYLYREQIPPTQPFFCDPNVRYVLLVIDR